MLPPDAERIPYISEYCDRWCERCAFTSRCAVYACEMAVAMCGDVVEGIELALGRPVRLPGAHQGPSAGADDDEDDGAEDVVTVAAIHLDGEACRREIKASPLSERVLGYSVSAYQWLATNRSQFASAADPVLAEALAIVQHDAAFVGAKLHRAVTGKATHARWRARGESRIQNDWNGSAKIALITLERSEAAWRVVAQVAGDEAPARFAETLKDLRQVVQEEFPHAMAFVRPGFDEPGR